MTYEEALKIIKNEKQCVIRAENCNRNCAKCDLLKPAQQILEAYNVAKESLEKQIPKKPLNVTYDDGYLEYWNCPNCHIQHSEEHKAFCDVCGQAIDWSSKNDSN